MANDELINSVARDYGLPVQNQFGQFQVGGPLAGHAGQLDLLYELSPGIGDIRALTRGARAGAETRLTPDLLGGAKAVPTRPGEAAFEIGTALPVIGDIGAGAKLITGVLADYGMLAGMGRLVFHGSPHRFAPEPGFPLGRFKHEFMGSGEGAQAYGWGTYIAENPDVAKGYADSLGGTFVNDQHIDDIIKGIGLDPNSGYADNAWQAAHNVGEHGYDEALARARELAKTELGGANQVDFLEMYGPTLKAEFKKNFYEVDLPDDQIDKMLDWDAPLSEQPDSVKKAIQEAIADGIEDGVNGPNQMFGTVTNSQWSTQRAAPTDLDNLDGASIKQMLQRVYGDEGASVKLREKGIPGIKYWDGGSRSAGSGTRNFVVFDEDIMKITKRNDEALDEVFENSPL